MNFEGYCSWDLLILDCWGYCNYLFFVDDDSIGYIDFGSSGVLRSTYGLLIFYARIPLVNAILIFFIKEILKE